MANWFRATQVFGIVVFAACWTAKYILHPHHLHLNVLLAGVAFLVGSELGFHIGRLVKTLEDREDQ